MSILPRTNIGPLTTTFTVPTACSVAYITAASLPSGYLGVTCAPSEASINGATYATTCYPPASQGAPPPDYPISGWGFYSPGLVCPAGYESACTATAGGKTGWSIEFTLTEGETAVGCCPSGFTCGRPNAQSCTRFATSGDVLTISKCPSQGFKETITLPGTITGSVTEQAVTSMSLNAPMIEIRWKSSDRSASSSSSSSSSSSPNATPGNSRTSQTGESSSGSSIGNSGGSSGLSTGEKAAIGVVVPVVVIALLVGLLIFFRRRHKSSQRAEVAYEPSRYAQLSESGKNPQELATHANSHELGSYNRRDKIERPTTQVYEAEDTSPSSNG